MRGQTCFSCRMFAWRCTLRAAPGFGWRKCGNRVVQLVAGPVDSAGIAHRTPLTMTPVFPFCRPPRRVAWLPLALTLAVAGCSLPPPRPAPPSAPTGPVPAPEPGGRSVQVNGHEKKVIEATNAFRGSRGLAGLHPSVTLIRIAQGHARNMARQDRYGDSDRNGHVLDGQDMELRIRAGGYAFARVAENVGYQLNRRDPVASMMQGWRASAGHRRNMLLEEITQIGVGAAQGRSGRWYFVQLFGRPAERARPVRTSQ